MSMISLFQGHCISTITPVNNGFGGGSYEYGPNGLDPYNESKDKIISTEGCFSCKVNGPRGKRNADDGANSTALAVEEADQGLNTSLPLKLRIKLDQTKHRNNIIKLQPALRTLKVRHLNLSILIMSVEINIFLPCYFYRSISSTILSRVTKESSLILSTKEAYGASTSGAVSRNRTNFSWKSAPSAPVTLKRKPKKRSIFTFTFKSSLNFK